MEEKHYDLPITNEVLTHMATAGRALHLYVWCVDKTTKKGGVLGGKTITAEYMRKELGVSLRTLRTYFQQLKPLLELKRVPFGYKIKVKGLDKWHKKGESDVQKNCISQDTVIQEEDKKGYAENCTPDVQNIADAIDPYKETITSVTNVTESEDKRPSSLHAINTNGKALHKRERISTQDVSTTTEGQDEFPLSLKVFPIEKEKALITGFRKQFKREPKEGEVEALKQFYLDALKQSELAGVTL